MICLKAAFWDYPQFMEEDALRQAILDGRGSSRFDWFLTRFLEHGRVVDTFKFFTVDEIAEHLPRLKLTPYARKKWERMLEVYGPAARE